MDRLREPTRRGSSSTAAQISSLRRPRSGNFKDSTAADEDEPVEDLHSARLRERPRKDEGYVAVSRHKRTRHTPHELHSRVEAVGDLQVGEVGASDKDDEVPISPNLLPRKPAKLRFHGKVDGNAVEIPTVPRKARTAISKRSHESLQGDSMGQQPSTLAAPLHTTLGPALKHVKRKKHNGPKVKAAKHTKISASISISEQEVEVAEALFDLARMVSIMGSPLCNDETQEAKMEIDETKGTAWPNSRESTPMCRQDSVSTPPSSHSAVSSPVRSPAPVSSLYIPSSEGSGSAPLKKISLSKLKVEDRMHSQSKNDVSVCAKGVVDFTGQSNGLKTLSINDNGLPSQGSFLNATATLLPVSNQLATLSNTNISAIEDKTQVPLDCAGVANAPSRNGSTFLEQKQECGKGEQETLDARDISALSKEIYLETSYSCKQEINMMASPNASAGGGIETNGNNADPNKVSQGNDKVSLLNIANHDNQSPAEARTVKEEGMSSVTETEAWINVQLSEDIKEQKLRENETAQQAAKQEFLSTAKNSKPELMCQRRAGGSGWPGSLPHMGYYPSAAAAAAVAAVAAAWPANGSIIGSVSADEKGHPGLQIPPVTFPSARPLYKRCTTHVYIAHFIDTQMQMQRHPVWASAYGTSAAGGLYSMKPYNINASLPPNTLVGGGLSGLTSLSIHSTPALGFVSSSMPQNDKSTAQGQKEKSPPLNTDVVDGTGASQSLHSRSQDKVSLLQAGLGPMFGYHPFAVSTSVSAEAEGNDFSDKRSSAAGAAAAVVSAGMSTSSNTDSVNVAAAQVQYLQAIIQQAGFPFSFSSGHMMPSTTGHMTQQQELQATHFFGNPFYTAPFEQQGSVAGRATPKITSPQGQNASLHQDARVSHSVSQLHQQQEQHLLSASSQPHQRIASQHVHHFGDRDLNLGGDVVSSAESAFPGYPTNMQSHKTSSLHASNFASSSSGGRPILQGHVSLAAKQLANMKLPLVQSVQTGGQGQAQQSSQHLNPQYRLMGVKNMDFQAAPVLSSVLSGAASNNTVGPGPLGLASVAAVMAPRGHTVLQTIDDSQLTYNAYQGQSLQQGYGKYLANVSLEESKTSAEISDEKRMTVRQAAPLCTSRMDTENESSLRESLGSKTVSTSIPMHQNLPGVTSNFLTSLANSRHGVPISVAQISAGSMTGALPSSKPVAIGQVSTVSSMIATSHDLNKTLSNVLVHVSSVSGQHGMRQGQAANQYSSQAKPSSRTQLGTTCVSPGPSQLLPGTYTGISSTKQAAYAARNQQPSPSSMQPRLPPNVSGSSSALASPSTSILKLNSSAAVKSPPPPAAKDSMSSSQKGALAAAVKKSDMPLTHSPGQVVAPHSVTVNMGQQQQQQAQHQVQHVIKQQQQWQQQQQQKQHAYLHQEQLQQGAQSTHHQVHVAGVTPTVTVQYHQASGTSQMGQAGAQKQSAQSLQMKQRFYVEQHFYQQQLQQQAQVMEPQQSARPSTHQHSIQHPFVVSASNCLMQQPSELQHQQVNKHQSATPHQQPFPLGSFGTSSGMVGPYTSSSISMGNGSIGCPASSDGVLMQVTSSKSSASMKPPGGADASVAGSNLQRSTSGISKIQGMGVKVTDVKLQPQSSSNISYLPYLQSATFSSSAAAVGKSPGTLSMHPQSGATVKATREPSAGSGREDNRGIMHQLNDDRACSLPLVASSLTSGDPHSPTLSGTTNVKSSIIPQINMDARAAPRASPLVVLHGLSGSHSATASSQSSQTCTVTSASMTADSVSTTG